MCGSFTVGVEILSLGGCRTRCQLLFLVISSVPDASEGTHCFPLNTGTHMQRRSVLASFALWFLKRKPHMFKKAKLHRKKESNNNVKEKRKKRFR